MQTSEVNTNTSKNIVDEWRKIILLGMMSIFLILMGLTSIFAPVPLVFVYLLYSRNKGIIVGCLCLVVMVVLAAVIKMPPVLGVLFLLAFINASVISEAIYRGLSPDRALVLAGVIFSSIILIGVGAYYIIGTGVIEAELIKVLSGFLDQIKTENADFIAKGGDEARMLQDFIKNPQKIVDRILGYAPAWGFTSLMLGFWVSFVIVLRSSMIWKKKREYAFTIRHLISFRAPDFFVWPLIMGLCFTLVGEYMMGPTGKLIGLNALYFLGFFYFIQGVGVYYDVLAMVGIRGGFRALLVFLAMSMAYRVLAVVGVFDLWINFRQWIKKIKKNKGDNL